jgi:hypothetical protein
MKRWFIAAAVTAFAFTPASAKMMPCTGENMAKSTAALTSMPDTPAKIAMQKEIGMANTEMSKGNMRNACKHYMRAQMITQ